MPQTTDQPPTPAQEREEHERRREQCFVDAGGEREFTPRFGDTIRGIWAGEKNPQRDGFYIRTVRQSGRLNPGKFYELTDGKGNVWMYSSSDTVRMARAVPLVAEAPREPTSDEHHATNFCAVRDLAQDDPRRTAKAIYGCRCPKCAALPASLAPMPEETQRLIADLEHRARYWRQPGIGNFAPKDCAPDFAEEIERALSHLRTAPPSQPALLALKAIRNHWREFGPEHGFDETLERSCAMLDALLASVAPQPEQPNTEQPHLADNGRKPVQGLDAEGRDAALLKAYDEGWCQCAAWANRTDLITDCESQAYYTDRDKALAKLRAAMTSTTAKEPK